MSQVLPQNNQPQQSPNPFDGFFKAVGGGVQAATTPAGEANLVAWLNNGQDQIVNGVQNNPVVQQVENGVTNRANQIGKAIGNQPVLPPQLGGEFVPSPTIADTFNAVNDNFTHGTIPGRGLLKGNATPASLARGALFLGTLADMKGDPEDTVKAETNMGTKPQINTWSKYINEGSGALVENKNFKEGTSAPTMRSQNASTTDSTNPQTPPPTGQTTAPNVEQSNPQTPPPTGSAQPVAERTYPVTEGITPPKEDILTNQQRNIQIDGQDIKNPNGAAQVNSTLNGYGIKGTQTEQLQQVSDKIGALAKQAQEVVANDGGATPKGDLIDTTAKNLSYANNHPIPATQAQLAASQYIDNVYTRAMGGDVTRNITGATPDYIPDTTVQKMKTIMNEDATSTFNQPDATKWTRNQTVSRFARDTADNVLDTNHPNASKLNNDMNDLYKAKPALMKGANGESATAAKVANTPPPNFFQKAGSFLQNPLVKYPLEFAGIKELTNGGKDISNLGNGMVATGAKAVNDVYNHFFQPKSVQNPFTSTQGLSTQNATNATNTPSQPPQSQFDIKQGADGHYHLSPQTTPAGKYMTQQAEQQQLSQVPYGSKEYAQIQQNYTQQQAQASAMVSQAIPFLASVKNTIAVGNEVHDLFAKMPPGFMNSNTTIKDMEAYSSSPGSPKAKLFANIDQLNKAFIDSNQELSNKRIQPGGDETINPGDSPQQAYEKWTNMMQYLTYNHDLLNDAYLSITSPTGTETSSGGPTTTAPIVQKPTNQATPIGLQQKNFPSGY